MKKLNILAAMFIAMVGFTACDSDRDSNPTYNQPESFVLNEPIYANTAVSLKESSSLTLTTSQPDFGYTAPVVYSTEISLDGTWVAPTETEKGTMRMLPTTSTSAKVNISTTELNRAIAELINWDDEIGVPLTQDVKVRLKASLNDQLTSVISNEITLKTVPFYISLKPAQPYLLYLIGNGVVGAWDNGWNSTGTGNFPMATVKGATYDEKTGKGAMVYTGHFVVDGFLALGSVDQIIDGTWGMKYSNTGVKGIDSPSGPGSDDQQDFTMPEEGWWKMEIDSKKLEFKFTQLDGEPRPAYTEMNMVGSFTNWADGAPVVMTQVGTATHVWYAEYTFDVDSELKFKTGDNWMGGDMFPIGNVTGNNIQVRAGSYKVFFNDLDQAYTFIEKP